MMFALLTAWSQCSPAAVNVDRTRIIIDASQKTVAVTLNNDDKTTPFLAQSWVTDTNEMKTDILIALPPLQRIDAGQKSQVRITQLQGETEHLPQDRETLFWFNVRGVPPKSEDDNILQLAMQSQLKLFYRPKAIIKSNSDKSERNLTAVRNAGHLILKNPTPYYITVAWLGADRSHRLSGFSEGVMVPPLGSLPLKASLPAETKYLWIGYIDDYGGLQMNRYTCDALRCTINNAEAASWKN
ncbi:MULTISPECIES: fimbria/pilus periplasmic chaperone [unclassified Providencia]|uniref:fimbria/pilus periplasmic chaperone n=1 Tax=unclassified Providencia TaxID=2633465 RepID=UPI002796092C|nr:fimbria/pilus periplasmic chaperone [Providencia sp. PROV216]